MLGVGWASVGGGVGECWGWGGRVLGVGWASVGGRVGECWG